MLFAKSPSGRARHACYIADPRDPDADLLRDIVGTLRSMVDTPDLRAPACVSAWHVVDPCLGPREHDVIPSIDPQQIKVIRYGRIVGGDHGFSFGLAERT